MVVTLVIIGIILAIIALLYTIKVGKVVNTRKSEYDTDTKATAKHPVLFNPIFLAYILGFGGLLVLIFYLASKYY
ncbi:hypothetical protein MUN88_01830 [Gracilibacillus caseinilyticus]|uniref:Short-chain dehydrogenase n=1 Tax=Gracilibacillus caseinilyticus TaxID=2932256 RepID=A0ABY4EY64_9BACI|nr:hypothetical protein [Gracilibacillus caseinilyticus]UOQ48905.1 hypothetical protein MUN88_01830 [Gracilibacillus caseinilyticus]